MTGDGRPVKRVACEWCGLPAGRATLAVVTEARPGEYRRMPLCPHCKAEFDRFGRKVPFSLWLAVYLQDVLSALAFALSFRVHLRHVRLQWRFRRRGVKVRAELLEKHRT